MTKFKVGDKVKFEGEEHLVVNIVDGLPVMVSMSVIDDECFIVDEEDLFKLHYWSRENKSYEIIIRDSNHLYPGSDW